LRYLPPRPARRHLGARRGCDAPRRRRHRLPDRAPPARCRHGVGLSDGRHRGLAAHEPGRAAGALRDAGRGRLVAAPGPRLSGRAGVVDRQAAGDVHRRPRPGRPLPRHDQRRDLGKPRRRGELRLPRAPPAARVRDRGDARGLMRVRLPTHLRAYTKGVAEVEASGATLAEVLADLDQRYPGLRFRVGDEQGRIRIATLSVNRPDRLNAWTGGLERRCYSLFEDAAAEPDVRVIVVAGAGRGWGAGADMDSLQGGGDSDDPDAVGLDRPIWFPPTIPKPIIAAINGACAGIGLCAALMCDLRFAAAGAKFTTAFVRRGLVAEH